MFNEPDSPDDLSDADMQELEAESGVDEIDAAGAATTDLAVDEGKVAWDDTSWVHLLADDDPPAADGAGEAGDGSRQAE